MLDIGDVDLSRPSISGLEGTGNAGPILYFFSGGGGGGGDEFPLGFKS